MNRIMKLNSTESSFGSVQLENVHMINATYSSGTSIGLEYNSLFQLGVRVKSKFVRQ